MNPAQGQFLISTPALADANFGRTVVLLCEHDASGTFGLIINRISGIRISDALAEVPGAAAAKDFLRIGGPVKRESVFILHRRIGAGGRPIIDGVRFGADMELLAQLLENSPDGSDDYRLFSGYSGWGPGQLDAEMKSGSWIVAPAEPSAIFADRGEDSWRDALRALGGRYALLAQAPHDPRLN